MAVSFECDMPSKRAKSSAAVKKYLEVEITSPLPDAVRITKLNIEFGSGRNDTRRLKKGCTSLMYACQQGLTDRVIEKVHSEVKKVLSRSLENFSSLSTPPPGCQLLRVFRLVVALYCVKFQIPAEIYSATDLFFFSPKLELFLFSLLTQLCLFLYLTFTLPSFLPPLFTRAF